MGVYVPTMALKQGKRLRIGVRKLAGDTAMIQVNRTELKVAREGLRFFAVRRGGVWSIYEVTRVALDGAKVTGLTEEAAFMWLHHRG